MTTTTATYTLFCWQCGTGFHYPTGHVTGTACSQCRPYHAEALQRQAWRRLAMVRAYETRLYGSSVVEAYSQHATLNKGTTA